MSLATLAAPYEAIGLCSRQVWFIKRRLTSRFRHLLNLCQASAVLLTLRTAASPAPWVQSMNVVQPREEVLKCK